MIKDLDTLEAMNGEELEYAVQELQAKDREFTLESLQKCDYEIRVDEDGRIVQEEAGPYIYSVRLRDGAWAVCLDVSHALGDYVVLRYDK